MYKINFNHLHYFQTIAELGSITKASRKLNITQPALSHQLKLLEEDLGVDLFDRVGKRLKINDDGMKVLEYATKIFRHTEEMIQYLQFGDRKIITIIKIGVLPWIPQSILYEIIKPLLYSSFIQVQISTRSPEQLTKLITAGEIDIIISDIPYSGRSKKLQNHHLKKEALACVCSDNLKTSLKKNFPKSLENKKIIFHGPSSYSKDAEENYLIKEDVNFHKVAEIDDVNLIIYSLDHGSVVSFLPTQLARQASKDKKISIVKLMDKVQINFWAITRKQSTNKGIIRDTIRGFKKAQKIY